MDVINNLTVAVLEYPFVYFGIGIPAAAVTGYLIAQILKAVRACYFAGNPRLWWEIRRIEAQFPGMRATSFGSNRDILLTERVSGAAIRELKRGQDF